jgi:hypothetical protein
MLLDLFRPPRPPRPKNISFVHFCMRVYGADDHLTPGQRREKRLEQMRERNKLKK